jgi:hypothetical protein
MKVFKRKKKHFLVAILPLIIIIALIFPKQKSFYTNLKISFLDKISTIDTGFSQLYAIYGTNDFYSLSSSLRIEKIPKLLKNIILGVERKVKIQKINIDIKFKNYKKILEDRDSAMAIGFGTNFRKVNGIINFKGKKIKAEFRLKGDLKDHWGSQNRMSLRVKLKGDNSILGFKEFSLQKTQTRLFPYDQIYQDIQRSLGNISSVHNYVDVTINGKNWGIMNVEEHMSKEFLEKQKLKESLILKIGDQRDWLYSYITDSKLIYKDYLLSDPYLNIEIYKSKKYLDDERYRKWYSYVSSELIKNPSNLFNINSFSTSFILSSIWNNFHTLEHNNSRYYFNPYDLELYPITTDQSVFLPFSENYYLTNPYEKILSDSDFKLNFDKNLKKIKSTLNNSDLIKNKWHFFFPLDDKIDFNILKDNADLINDIEDFEERMNYSEITRGKDELSELKAQMLFDHIHARHFVDGQIHIYNLLNEDIQINNIIVGDKTYNDFVSKNLRAHNNQYNPLVIKTDLIGIKDSLIEIETEFKNSKRNFKINFSHEISNLLNPIKKLTNLNNLNFIESVDEENIKIKAGNWQIENPIVVDRNLIIDKGTKLIFGKNAYILINGGSLNINGSKDQKVILTSKDEDWKGIYVLNSTRKSFIKNSIISKLSFFKDGLLNLTGGITFYKSDVQIEDVKLSNCIAEDFLNIIQSNFLINNILIENTISDGFDSDFSSGEINNSFFFKIDGDAIDFSGSNVLVQNSVFQKIKDKAISAGEASELEITSIKANSVGVGLAAKDGSNVILSNSNFTNYKLKGLMSYKKKSFYNSPSLIASNIYFDSIINCCLSEKGSNMILDGKKIFNKRINIDSLYNTQIMKKWKTIDMN